MAAAVRKKRCFWLGWLLIGSVVIRYGGVYCFLCNSFPQYQAVHGVSQHPAAKTGNKQYQNSTGLPIVPLFLPLALVYWCGDGVQHGGVVRSSGVHRSFVVLGGRFHNNHLSFFLSLSTIPHFQKARTRKAPGKNECESHSCRCFAVRFPNPATFRARFIFLQRACVREEEPPLRVVRTSRECLYDSLASEKLPLVRVRTRTVSTPRGSQLGDPENRIGDETPPLQKPFGQECVQGSIYTY